MCIWILNSHLLPQIHEENRPCHLQISCAVAMRKDCTVRLCPIGINRFWLVGLYSFNIGETVFGWFGWSTFSTGLKTSWNSWKSFCVIMSYDCSLCKDYHHDLLCFNQKWLEKRCQLWLKWLIAKELGLWDSPYQVIFWVPNFRYCSWLGSSAPGV